MLRKLGAPEWIFGPLFAILIFAMGFVVGSAPHSGDVTEPKGADKTRDRADYYYAYRAIRDWFGKDAAGFFTFWIFIVGSGQAALFYVQLRLMRQSLSDAKKAADAAAEGAAAAKEAAEAAKLQADAIIKSEQPFVVIRITDPGVKMLADGKLDFADRRFKFRLVNYGKTPAAIHELTERFVIKNPTDVPDPLDPLKHRGRLLTDNIVSAPGYPHKFSTNLMNNIPDFQELLSPTAFSKKRVFFQGFIRYSDAFGAHYITGFFFAFRPEADAWEQRGDKRYNYTRIERPQDIPPHPNYPPEEE